SIPLIRHHTSSSLFPYTTLFRSIFFIFIILIAAVLQTSTGFGFSIISTPFMLLIMEPREAVQISLILSLVISFSLVGKVKKDVDKGILKRFTVGSIVGLP